jgi:hypothetical protein
MTTTIDTLAAAFDRVFAEAAQRHGPIDSALWFAATPDDLVADAEITRERFERARRDAAKVGVGTTAAYVYDANGPRLYEVGADASEDAVEDLMRFCFDCPRA